MPDLIRKRKESSMPTDGIIPSPQAVRRSSVRESRIASVLLSAPVGLTAACITLAIITGCMSLSIGNRTIETAPTEEGVLCQQGEVHVPPNSLRVVHYPIPFARTPNLEVSSTFDDCEVREEHEDHFVLRNPNCFGRTVKWKARGLKCVPPPPEGPAAAPELPPAPIPAEAPPPTRNP
jgi:hypothetical protein